MPSSCEPSPYRASPSAQQNSSFVWKAVRSTTCRMPSTSIRTPSTFSRLSCGVAPSNSDRRTWIGVSVLPPRAGSRVSTVPSIVR